MKKNFTKLSIIIPAYNEAKTIHFILDKVKAVVLPNDIQKELNEIGVIVFNPYNHPFVGSSVEDNDAREKLGNLIKLKNYDMVSSIVKKIRSEDLRCVDVCDFCFVYINPSLL